jgi:hypothetical protein
MAMDRREMIAFEAVEVVRETELALLCLIAGERHWIGRMQLLPGSEVKHAGDRGRVVLPQWLVIERGLA